MTKTPMNQKPLKSRLPLAWLSVLLFGAALMAGCGDSISKPESLADQKALSLLAKDRHYSVSFYYEGTMVQGDQPMHVFAERILNMFWFGDSINLYTLPGSVLTIGADIGSYTGPDALRMVHEFHYEHDAGQFELYQGKRTRHVSPLAITRADFEEEFTLAQERCRNARDAALDSVNDVSLADYAASICFWSEDFDISLEFAGRLKDMGGGFGGEPGYAQHKHHTFMGRHSLRNGDVDAAIQHLRASAQVKPSATMRSFGPNMSLARDLLLAGESQAVLDYLGACGEFWNDDQLRNWIAQVQAGATPDFSANLHY